MSRRVWALTSGCYDAYRVCAIFESKANAEQALELPSSDDIWSKPDSITCLRAYDEGEMPQQVTVYYRQANIWDDGTDDMPEPHNRYNRVMWDWDNCPNDDRPKVRFVRRPVHKNNGGWLEVHGTDEQAVNQSYSDNLARIRANVESTGKAKLK